MQRQILAQAAWRAIAAVAGFFTLTFASASPVDLWNLTVKSRQGEPFVARVKIVSLPSERITARCLSMGPESDAPGSEMPFLGRASLKLNAAGNAVTISTSEPIVSPGVELVLRVKCPDAPLYARHFTALIPPATSKAAKARVAAAIAVKAPVAAKPAGPIAAATGPKPTSGTTAPVEPAAETSAPSTDKSPAGSPGFHLKLLPGDSVESIAAVLFPGQRAQQQALVQQVLAGNPRVFPGARQHDVAAGTVLWFPDLQALRKAVPATQSRTDRVATGSRTDTIDKAPESSRSRGGPVTLRRALELGDRPGPQECRQLMELCGAPVSSAPPIADGKVAALESGMQQLHLKQDGIDQQLQRLEQSLLALQSSVKSLPAHIAPAPSVPSPAPAPPAPPRVEIRTVVQPSPIEWYVWLALVAIVVAVGLGGFAYGRRGSFSRGLQETDAQLDRMLAGAADVMREFEANPVRVPPAPRPQPPVAPRPVAPRPPPPPALSLSPPPSLDVSLPAEPEPLVLSPPGIDPLQMTDVPAEPRIEPPPPVMDTPANGDAPAPQVAGLSNEILFEMDQALDNTRSMFTDVDRFIALGRTQNALSLLQFQVHKDPTDRDSWIKLMAIYRQEKMDTELTKAAREFRNNFPNETPPAV